MSDDLKALRAAAKEACAQSVTEAKRPTAVLHGQAAGPRLSGRRRGAEW